LFFSIRIILGKAGRNIIEYIKPRLIVLSLCYREEKILMKHHEDIYIHIDIFKMYLDLIAL